MTEIITLENGNKVESGCWLDGAHGWTNAYRIVDIAVHHGMELDTDDTAIVEWYRKSGESDFDGSEEELGRLEAMTGQGGITDKAIDYIDEQLPEGWVLSVEMGEYSVIPDWMDCANNGISGCSVEYRSDANGKGREVVILCPDHNPCEGHGGEDADLTNPNVGIGETTYCDGSCVTGGKGN